MAISATQQFVSVPMDRTQVKRVDHLVAGKSRSAYIREAVEQKLVRDERAASRPTP